MGSGYYRGVIEWWATRALRVEIGMVMDGAGGCILMLWMWSGLAWGGVGRGWNCVMGVGVVGRLVLPWWGEDLSSWCRIYPPGWLDSGSVARICTLQIWIWEFFLLVWRGLLFRKAGERVGDLFSVCGVWGWCRDASMSGRRRGVQVADGG